MKILPLALLCAGFMSAGLAAQREVRFPLDLDRGEAQAAQLRLRPNVDGIAALLTADALTMTDVGLPGGASVELALVRIPVEELGIGFFVDGRPAPGLLAGLDLSVWKGQVVGEVASEVLLSFSNAGSRGWITTGGEVFHLMAQPGAGTNWRDGHSILVGERELANLGIELGQICGADALLSNALAPDAVPPGDSPSFSGTGGMSMLYECAMAIETDYDLNQIFGGDLGAETTYVTTLLAAASDRYAEQIGTQLTFPYVQFYSDPGDPWSTPESGGSSIDMLNEFVAAWSGGPLPGNATLGHFLSGADLGGGVAYLGVLCDTNHDFSFGVSGNLGGNVSFPVVQGPMNWDFHVFCHEVGHNFDSPHTHDFCPPLDECAPAQYFGACQDEELCITDGTIMSYCHLCPGGSSNITTFFHPTVVDRMRSHAEACLPIAFGITANPPTILPPDVPSPLVATVIGISSGDVELNYRFAPSDAFIALPMSDQGGGVFAADLPAPDCDDLPEFFFSVSESGITLVQTEVFMAGVGHQTFVFSDDFEADLGWTVGDPGDDATTGVWVRVDPNGTSAQPAEGIDSPVCYVTGQGSVGGGLGENDVDGGRTTLTSPVIDLAGQEATIGYWRWYVNDGGASPNADVFEVEITNDASVWVDVETVGPGGPETSGGWFYHQFDVASLVMPTSQVQVRFIASDEGDGSIVEAAVDGFEVFRLSCDVCQPDLGFEGPGGVELSICGEPLLSGNTALLSITNAPSNAAAVVVYSNSFSPVPFLGGMFVPLPIVGTLSAATDGSGSWSQALPGDAASTTFYVQAIVANMGQFLLTNAVAAEFQ